MTSKGQITKIASRDGVDARVVERDYVLVHAVALISAHDTDRTLIFKGGTSLRLLHFEHYRYSADLDYSVVAGSEEQARELIRGALAQKPPDTIKQLELTEDFISYVGPLGASRTIKLDLADDELVVNTEQRPLLQRWADTFLDPAVGGSGFLDRAAADLHLVARRTLEHLDHKDCETACYRCLKSSCSRSCSPSRATARGSGRARSR